MEEAIKGNNKEEIEAKIGALENATKSLYEILAQSMNQQGGGDTGGASHQHNPNDAKTTNANDENVIDAEYSEVNNNK